MILFDWPGFYGQFLASTKSRKLFGGTGIFGSKDQLGFGTGTHDLGNIIGVVNQRESDGQVGVGGSHFSQGNGAAGKLEIAESAFFTTEEGDGLALFGTIHSKG